MSKRESEKPLSRVIEVDENEYTEEDKFTVTPVRIESPSPDDIERDQDSDRTSDGDLPHLDLSETNDSENNDSYNQNSITVLLSSKFRDFHQKIKRYSIASIASADSLGVRFRKRLISKYESLNYDICENSLYAHEQERLGQQKIRRRWMMRWLVMFLIGVLVALMAVAVELMIEYASSVKFSLLNKLFDRCSKENCLYLPVLLWVVINTVISCLASALVTYVEPTSAGSGIPMIKAFLNGVKIPGLMSLRALIAKVLGIVLSILGGLACGKEGPMIHSGAIIAAGLSQSRSHIFNKDFKVFEYFRTDTEVRDFVSGGAAAGVAAAFGAPVGGVLFSLEEGASFWNQSLTWRVFFAAMVATFSVNIILSAIHGHPTALSSPGLVTFGMFQDISYDLIEIPVFFLMAVIGGLLGALFVFMNYKLTVFRRSFSPSHSARWLSRKWVKVAETGLVAAVSAILAFVLIYTVNECIVQPVTTTPSSDSYDNGHAPANNVNIEEEHSTPLHSQMFCPDGQYNAFSELFLRTPESMLKAMLHDHAANYSVTVLCVFTPLFFVLAVWTYGLSVSSGVFVPSLLIGAAWGRLIGIGIGRLFPFLGFDESRFEKNIGKYALIGAACQLGGTVRMTISLTVILTECTGDITFGLPMMLVLMITKWVGDFFDTSLYDMNIHVLGIPVLSWDPPAMSYNVKAGDIMNRPVVTLQPMEKVSNIVDVLMEETHCGFPLTEAAPLPDGPFLQVPSQENQQTSSINKSFLQVPTSPPVENRRKHHTPGRLKGLILRSQLTVLLHKRMYAPEGTPQPKIDNLEEFRDTFRIPIKIEDIELADEEMDHVVDLRPYMNPFPHTAVKAVSLPKIFRLFRGLGLRHLIIVNDKNEVLGMVTRKDLAKYRTEPKRGILKMEVLQIHEH